MLEALIVDGYNVLHQSTVLSEVFAKDQDAARTRLLDAVASFAAGRYRAWVVFDGAGNPSSDGEPSDHAGVTVIFSAYGKDADGVIEDLARAERGGRSGAIVVTSDATTQNVVMGGGVRRMSAAEFLSLIESEAAENDDEQGSHSRRVSVQSRLDPDTRARLDRMTRGG